MCRGRGACRIGQPADDGGWAGGGAVARDGGDGGDQDGETECDFVFVVAAAAVRA
jgi:hypothetical protein